MKFKNEKIKNITIGMIVIFLINQLFFGIDMLALTPYDGMSYTLISSGFIHGDYIHLAMNSIVFYWLATQFIGVKTFLSVFTLSLLGSSLLSLFFITTISPALVVGASGAISGLFAYIFFRNNLVQEFYINFILMNAIPLAMGMNLAWYAHLGGAIVGYLYFKYGPKERIMWILR